jgi:malonate-semialdehyde dehydrogenase (acetylating)/methylmalonate-semialdehyde dehydrogenase
LLPVGIAKLIGVSYAGNSLILVPKALNGFGGWRRSLFGEMNAYGEKGVVFCAKQWSVTRRSHGRIGEGA